MQRLLINKENLSSISVETQSLSLQDNEILLEIDSFGLSANNITYAVLGQSFGYWGFFPSSEPAQYGVLPVWGFANVAASNNPDVTVGKRVFGYLPFASHVVVQAKHVDSTGFFDAHSQRRSISPVYDHYVFCDTDAGYQLANESWQITYRPLFMTSFVLSNFVASQYANANNIFITSASSKTAYGTAMLLKQQLAGQACKIVGLSSSANIDFVNELGCYDEVINYDDIDAYMAKLNSLSSNTSEENKQLILDFAGNKSTLHALQKGLQTYQVSTQLIGATDVNGRNANDLNTSGEVFFAPSQVKLMQDEWGKATFFAKYQSAWEAFLSEIKPLIQEINVEGFEHMSNQYLSALQGNINPRQMLILRP